LWCRFPSTATSPDTRTTQARTSANGRLSRRFLVPVWQSDKRHNAETFPHVSHALVDLFGNPPFISQAHQ
jgi:hypothetical protein